MKISKHIGTWVKNSFLLCADKGCFDLLPKLPKAHKWVTDSEGIHFCSMKCAESFASRSGMILVEEYFNTKDRIHFLIIKTPGKGHLSPTKVVKND